MLFLMMIEDPVKRDKLAELYHKYKKDVYTKAKSILRDEEMALDMTQETFIRVSRHLDKLEDTHCNKTRAYLVIIVKNLCLDYIRSKKDQLSSNYEDVSMLLPDTDDTPEDIIIKMDRTKEMADYLSRINPFYAEVINLRYYQGYSNKEIADLLGISHGNARVRLKRALEAIKVLIEEGVAVYE